MFFRFHKFGCKYTLLFSNHKANRRKVVKKQSAASFCAFFPLDCSIFQLVSFFSVFLKKKDTEQKIEY